MTAVRCCNLEDNYLNTTIKMPLKKAHNETVSVLQGFLIKNYDAEKAYTKAMTHTKSPALKCFLQQQAAQRRRFAKAIAQRLRQLNEIPIESGSISGTLYRTWITIKSSVAGNKDEAVLKEVMRGEKASLKDYQDVLKNKTLPSVIVQELERQMKDIESILNGVIRLKNGYS